MSEREKVCALTGHRDLAGFDENALAYELESLVKEGYTAFLCGMAQGFDLLALKLLAALKQKRTLYLEACIPFEGQEKSFSAETRKLYQELLNVCDRKTVLFPSYCTGCYLARDTWWTAPISCLPTAKSRRAAPPIPSIMQESGAFPCASFKEEPLWIGFPN